MPYFRCLCYRVLLSGACGNVVSYLQVPVVVLCLTSGVSATGSYLLCLWHFSLELSCLCCSVVPYLQVPVVVVLHSGAFGNFFGYLLVSVVVLCPIFRCLL